MKHLLPQIVYALETPHLWQQDARQYHHPAPLVLEIMPAYKPSHVGYGQVMFSTYDLVETGPFSMPGLHERSLHQVLGSLVFPLSVARLDLQTFQTTIDAQWGPTARARLQALSYVVADRFSIEDSVWMQASDPEDRMGINAFLKQHNVCVLTEKGTWETPQALPLKRLAGRPSKAMAQSLAWVARQL